MSACFVKHFLIASFFNAEALQVILWQLTPYRVPTVCFYICSGGVNES